MKTKTQPSAITSVTPITPITPIQQMPSREYLYSPGTTLKRRMPMANVFEPRTDLFPATNRPTAPGMHVDKTKPKSTDIVKIDYPDGSYLLVSGVRRERHRRMLDFLIGYAPPIRLCDGNVAFFFDRTRAAEAVFSDKRQYTRVEALLEGEMQRIQFAFRRPGEGDFDERSCSPLVTSYKRPYRPGDDGILDALITFYGYEPEALNGLSYAVLSREYIEHISGQFSMKLCYAPALPIIFEMGEVAASIARYAISNEYLGDHPLHRVLDEIGAAGRGKSRETAIKDLRFGESAELLGKLGISIKPKGPLGQLFLLYDSKRADVFQSLYYN
jgi:hypothetical protein